MCVFCTIKQADTMPMFASLMVQKNISFPNFLMDFLLCTYKSTGICVSDTYSDSNIHVLSWTQLAIYNVPCWIAGNCL